MMYVQGYIYTVIICIYAYLVEVLLWEEGGGSRIMRKNRVEGVEGVAYLVELPAVHSHLLLGKKRAVRNVHIMIYIIFL